jgi:hypothetical protein
MAGAVALYLRIRGPYPTLPAIAMLEQSRCLFLADPQDPTPAIAQCREAMGAVPPIGSRAQIVEPLENWLAVLYLADGDESAAAAMLADRIGKDPRAVVPQLGDLYSNLAMTFSQTVQNARPARFPAWRARAIHLSPQSATVQILRSQAAFEDGRDAEVVDAFQKAEALGYDADEIDGFLSRILASRPDSEPLRRFAAARGVSPATRPTTTSAPTTQE